mmetsp:Transcript_22117/g.59670  ORF Transcript_22117/g.59670 Transcript_22117/m.59670 type:complete len:409 (-) Transcript_22117:353-1579(-)
MAGTPRGRGARRRGGPRDPPSSGAGDAAIPGDGATPAPSAPANAPAAAQAPEAAPSSAPRAVNFTRAPYSPFEGGARPLSSPVVAVPAPSAEGVSAELAAHAAALSELREAFRTLEGDNEALRAELMQRRPADGHHDDALRRDPEGNLFVPVASTNPLAGPEGAGRNSLCSPRTFYPDLTVTRQLMAVDKASGHRSPDWSKQSQLMKLFVNSYTNHFYLLNTGVAIGALLAEVEVSTPPAQDSAEAHYAHRRFHDELQAVHNTVKALIAINSTFADFASIQAEYPKDIKGHERLAMRSRLAAVEKLVEPMRPNFGTKVQQALDEVDKQSRTALSQAAAKTAAAMAVAELAGRSAAPSSYLGKSGGGGGCSGGGGAGGARGTAPGAGGSSRRFSRRPEDDAAIPDEDTE